MQSIIHGRIVLGKEPKNSIEIAHELLLLNFKTKESKANLARVLNIDYEKLELYQIQHI